MRWKLASLCALTALAALAIAAPQQKAQRYNARLIVQSTSIETYDFKRDSPNEHQSMTGSADIETNYSQNFIVVVQSGIVSLAESQGPAASSVTATANSSMETKDASGKGITSQETFSMSPRSATETDSGSGTSSGSVLQDFQVSGQGLAIRILTHATLKGKCTSNIPPGNACLGDSFAHGGGSPSENSTAHNGASPMMEDVTSTFDFYDKPDPSDPSKGTCDTCFVGGIVQGGLGSNYSFTGNGSKTSNEGGWSRNWKVSVKAQIMILGKA